MDKKLKAMWVKALMSGKYDQGKGWLYAMGGGYCCLGVLDEIADLRSPRTDFIPSVRCGIPMPVQKQLAKLNDEGIPFPVIAGFIQENL